MLSKNGAKKWWQKMVSKNDVKKWCQKIMPKNVSLKKRSKIDKGIKNAETPISCKLINNLIIY